MEDYNYEDEQQLRGGSSLQPSTIVYCQADNCTADLTEAKRYHRRHKVCEFHAKAPVVCVNSIHQRFCQQCSKCVTTFPPHPQICFYAKSLSLSKFLGFMK